jgi:hypothetical protein
MELNKENAIGMPHHSRAIRERKFAITSIFSNSKVLTGWIKACVINNISNLFLHAII